MTQTLLKPPQTQAKYTITWGKITRRLQITGRFGCWGCDRINRSELVPELDFELLTRSVLMKSIGEAAWEFERAIAQNKS